MNSAAPAPMIAPRERHLTALVRGLDRIARPVDLLAAATPVFEEPELARIWNLGSLWIKDDGVTAPVYGGSKVRNLEYFLGVARARGAESVATMGPHGSHQALATAVHGAAQGFRTRALLVPQPPVREVELNRRLLPALGMDIVRCDHYWQIPVGYIRTRWGRKNTYWIPPGSKHPLGVLGVIEGALELAQAIRDGELPCPDDVVVSTGTCATAAGLYLGFAIAGLPIRVVAVRMVPMFMSGTKKLKKLAQDTLQVLRSAGYSAEPEWGDILWIDDHAAPGYGLSNEAADRAMETVQAAGYFRTEITYTGKALGIFTDGLLRERNVVFWNTYSAVDPDPRPTPESGA